MGITSLNNISNPFNSVLSPFNLRQKLIFEAKNNRKMLFEPFLATEQLMPLLYIDKVLPKEQLQWVLLLSKLYLTHKGTLFPYQFEAIINF